jgi:cytoskeletal protein CcmA (bactofilin family)
MFARKAAKLEMVLGENSKITGDVESLGTILVEGSILGNIQGEKVILGEKAFVKGNITASSISIAGKIEGHLSGREAVEIKDTARIYGDVLTKSLSMMSGAILNGMCRMEDAHMVRDMDTDKNVVEFTAKG